MYLCRRKKLILKVAVVTIAFWIFLRCLWLPMVTKKNQAIKWTSLFTSCQQQFNNEFNFPIGTDFPMPTSIFHQGTNLTMIFSIQNFQFDDYRPERVRNFTSPLITYAQRWFLTNTWTIEYHPENGQSELVICKPIRHGTNLPLVIIVTCDINSIFQTYVLFGSFLNL